jgi:hypothetical protein
MTASIVWVDGFAHYDDPALKYGTIVSTPVIGDYGKFAKGIETGKSNNHSSFAKAGFTTKQYWACGFFFQRKSSNGHANLIAFRTGTSAECAIEIDANGHIQYWYHFGVRQASTLHILQDTWYYLEALIKLDGSNGLASVWITEEGGAATKYIDILDGDTRNNNNSADGFQLGENISATSDEVWISDLWVSSGDSMPPSLGPQRVHTLYPDGAGADTEWTASSGNNWECVNETPPSSSDYVYSQATGTQDTYDHPAMIEIAGDVNAVAVNLCARKDDTETRKVTGVLSLNSSESQGSDKTLTSSYQIYQDIFPLDPDSSAWDKSKVDGVYFGQKETT